MPEKDKYFEDLLDDVFSDEETEEEEGNDTEEESDIKEEKPEEEELSEEEQRKKNKDAEEARKRRAREAKEKEEAEAKEKEQAEKKEVEETNVNKLGEQLAEFKKKYPDIDLAKLDEDKNFKKFIDGKLLGKKEFVELYEDYVELVSDVSDNEDVKIRHQIKRQASSGTSQGVGEGVPEIYSEEEFNKLVEKMPTMSQGAIDKVWDKFQKSLEFYKKK